MQETESENLALTITQLFNSITFNNPPSINENYGLNVNDLTEKEKQDLQVLVQRAVTDPEMFMQTFTNNVPGVHVRSTDTQVHLVWPHINPAEITNPTKKEVTTAKKLHVQSSWKMSPTESARLSISHFLSMPSIPDGIESHKGDRQLWEKAIVAGLNLIDEMAREIRVDDSKWTPLTNKFNDWITNNRLSKNARTKFYLALQMAIQEASHKKRCELTKIKEEFEQSGYLNSHIKYAVVGAITQDISRMAMEAAEILLES